MSVGNWALTEWEVELWSGSGVEGGHRKYSGHGCAGLRKAVEQWEDEVMQC